MKKMQAHIRSCEPLIRFLLAILLLAFVQVPAATPPGIGGPSHDHGQTLESQSPLDLSISARQSPPSHEISFGALVQAATLPAPASPAPHQFERLQPYRLPGVCPLSLHLIYLQKTSADL